MNKKALVLIPLFAASAMLVGCKNKENTNTNTSSSEIDDPTKLKGDGTAKNPYKIGNKNDLGIFAETFHEHEGAYYQLTADIDYNDAWTPIGNGATELEDEKATFKGTFDGNGHKITNLKFTKTNDKGMVGFFGFAYGSYIHDLEVSVTIDLSVSKLLEEAYIGGIVAYGENTQIDNCKVNVLKCKVASAQVAASTIMMGGVAGYTAYYDPNNQAIMTSFNTNNSVSGNLRLTAPNFPVASIGGVIGFVNTGFGSGSSSITNNLFSGVIEGGTYVGGIVGTSSYYVGLANNIAISASLTTYGNGYSYAGGIIGMSSTETSCTGNIADVTTIKANKSNTAYKSFVGDIVGYAASDEYDEYSDYQGCLLFNNYTTGSTLSADKTTVETNVIEEINEEALVNAGFNSKAWDFTSIEPLSVDNLSSKVTIDSNGGTKENETITINLKNDIEKTYTMLDEYENSKAGYSMYGVSTDKNGENMFRWYTPITNDITLYAAYADLTPIIGTFSVTCQYYESVFTSGAWAFDENYFYWNYKDGGSSKYEYVFDGKHIFIGEYLGVWPESFGGYEYEIFILEDDGEISALDVNDDSAVFHGEKVSDTPSFIDYDENTPFLGVWYNETNYVEITSTGLVKSKYLDPKAPQAAYFGGITVDGEMITIRCYGRLPETQVVYNSEKDLLIGATTVFAREQGISTYSTEKGYLKVVLYKGETLVIINNEITDKTVTGDITKDSSITIDGVTYQVNGKVISYNGEEPDIDFGEESNETDVDTFKGTYTLVASGNTSTLVINGDGTGTFNDGNITYIVSGNTLSFEWNYEEYTITKNGDTYSGTFTYDYEEYNFSSVTKVA